MPVQARQEFFKETLPAMVKLTLDLPKICTQVCECTACSFLVSSLWTVIFHSVFYSTSQYLCWREKWNIQFQCPRSRLHHYWQMHSFVRSLDEILFINIPSIRRIRKLISLRKYDLFLWKMSTTLIQLLWKYFIYLQLLSYRLFCSQNKSGIEKRKFEKFKCLLNYFKRVTSQGEYFV